MISPNDSRWKVASIPTVKIPMVMPHPLDRVRPHDLQRHGVFLPLTGGWIDVTEPNVGPSEALADGHAMAKHYVQQDRFGNHAQVVALIEWEDEEGIYSAAVQKYHSDT